MHISVQAGDNKLRITQVCHDGFAHATGQRLSRECQDGYTCIGGPTTGGTPVEWEGIQDQIHLAVASPQLVTRVAEAAVKSVEGYACIFHLRHKCVFRHTLAKAVGHNLKAHSGGSLENLRPSTHQGRRYLGGIAPASQRQVSIGVKGWYRLIWRVFFRVKTPKRLRQHQWALGVVPGTVCVDHVPVHQLEIDTAQPGGWG